MILFFLNIYRINIFNYIFQKYLAEKNLCANKCLTQYDQYSQFHYQNILKGLQDSCSLCIRTQVIKSDDREGLYSSVMFQYHKINSRLKYWDTLLFDNRILLDLTVGFDRIPTLKIGQQIRPPDSYWILSDDWIL